MPCAYPVGTYRLDGSTTYRPCGGCIDCRLGYAQQWAIRSIHEAQMYDENCFLTLTYNNENLPMDGSVHKKELTKFIKRLRRRIEPTKIRFFGCGEYGEKFNRPHYHLCLFNYDFPDKQILKAKRFRTRKFGIQADLLYSSEMLAKIWKKGFHSIGEVNMQTAGYVARYVTKKVTGKNQDKHYKGKNPEFALMSRMPGIGAPWLEKYKCDVYPKDYHVINGKKVRPPRYYDSWLEKNDPKMMAKIKERRKENIDEDAARVSDIKNAKRKISQMCNL